MLSLRKKEAKASVKIVILITIDCLRWDYLTYIVSENTNKRLSSIVHFSRAFSNGPGTNQSFPSIFSSTPFLLHGDLRLASFVRTLASALTDANYYTVGFHSNPFLSSKLGWSRGFREFYDFLSRVGGPAAIAIRSNGTKRVLLRVLGRVLSGSSRYVWTRLNRFYYKFKGIKLPYIEAKELNNYIISWLRCYDKQQPLFLWIHYMDVHNPFAPPEPWLKGFDSREKAFLFNYKVDPEKPSREDIEKLMMLYEGEVKYVALAISEFLDYLEDGGLLENSLVIITADHGEAFMEHNKLGHAYDILYNEVLHIPLLIYGLDEEGVIKEPVQLMDLAPTILDILGVKCPRTFMGRSFYPLIRGEEWEERPIFSESAVPDLINLRYDTSRYIVSVIYKGWKLIYDFIHDRRPRLELYNLKRDFDEHVNLVENEPEVVKELLGLIKDHLKEIKVRKALYRKLESIKVRLKK